MYRLRFTANAQKDLKKIEKKYPNAIKKIISLLEEIKEHPRTGTGQVEQLKYYEDEVWSRRISHEHRLVYQINEDMIEILVLSAFGHY